MSKPSLSADVVKQNKKYKYEELTNVKNIIEKNKEMIKNNNFKYQRQLNRNKISNENKFVNVKKKKINKEKNKHKEKEEEIQNIDIDSILGNSKRKKISLLDTSNKKCPNVYSMEYLNKQRLKEQFKINGINMKIHEKYESFKNCYDNTKNNMKINQSCHQFEATFNPEILKEQMLNQNKVRSASYSINTKPKDKYNNLNSNKKKIQNKKKNKTNSELKNKPQKQKTITSKPKIISKKNIKLIKQNNNLNNNNYNSNNNNDFYFTFYWGNKLNNKINQNKVSNNSKTPKENNTFYGPSTISQVIEHTNKLNQKQLNNYNSKDYNIFKSISCEHILPNDNLNESNIDTNESNNLNCNSPQTHQQFRLCKCLRKPKVDTFAYLNNLKHDNKLKLDKMKLNQQKYKEQLLQRYKTLNEQLTNSETVHADLLIKQYFDLL